MDDRQHHYNTWRNGISPSPLMVQGYGARPSGTPRYNDTPRKAFDFSGRSVNSHLNRMRNTITGNSQINIQELLKQATEDFESQGSYSRYKNGATGNWLNQRDQSDIRSSLYIKGMDTESRVISHAHSHAERPTVKVIRANIPRAEMEEPQRHFHSKSHYHYGTPPNTSRTLQRRPSTADAVRRMDTQRHNTTVKERREGPIKLPMTAWDTTADESDDLTPPKDIAPPTTPSSDKESVHIPSPPNSLDLNSDDEGFLSNAEEDNLKKATPKAPRDADEDVMINGPNYQVRTDQLLQYYMQEEHQDGSPQSEASDKQITDKSEQLNSRRMPHETMGEDGNFQQASGNNIHVNIPYVNSDSPEPHLNSRNVSRNQLQSSIIIETPVQTSRAGSTTSSSADLNSFQNHPLRRSRSPRRSNTVLHRRSHHSPWRTYNTPTPQDMGGLATDSRSSFIEITNPLNLQSRKKPPTRPASMNNSFIGHGLHSYRPRGRGSRSMRVSVSNPDLTSIRVIGTSMSSSNALHSFREDRNRKFQHSSFSAMT